MTRDTNLQAYFDEAATWDTDRATQYRRTARVAWWTAGAGWTLALVTAAALMLLMPLKRVDPFVIRVDNTTGLIDTVPVYTGTADNATEVLTRYLLSHYVTVCERFNHATAESDYEECGAFHTPQRNQAWYEQWNTNNPGSPLNVNKDGSTVRAQIKAVSFFERANGVADLAQVRYLKGRKPAGGAEEQHTHWIATLQYAYAAPAKDPKVRRWNPLGFKVIEFKSEPEVSVEATDTAPASAAAAPGKVQ